MPKTKEKEEKERPQLNVRLDPEIIKLIDEKRIELQRTTGSFPSRSDVMRRAIEEYLGYGKKGRG